MKQCALPPRPPLQIKKKLSKGSKRTKLQRSITCTHARIEASEMMKTPDENILKLTKAFRLL